MAAFLSQHVLWAFAAVQAVGLLSAAMARFAENRTGQASFQWLFLIALGLVGLVTLATLSIGWTAWVFSGATLALMVVLAVWDPGYSGAR